MSPRPIVQGEVVIDMTSGLPPPQWTLSPAEVEEINTALGSLTPAPFVTLFDGLGYRGFVITSHAPERRIRVQNGHVEVDENGVKNTYADANKRLEKLLLSLSKPHIEPQLYALLEEGIGR